MGYSNYPPGVTGYEDVFWDEGGLCECGSGLAVQKCDRFSCRAETCEDCGVKGEHGDLFCSEECKADMYGEEEENEGCKIFDHAHKEGSE